MGKYAMVTLTPKLRQELSPNTMALIKAETGFARLEYLPMSSSRMIARSS